MKIKIIITNRDETLEIKMYKKDYQFLGAGTIITDGERYIKVNRVILDVVTAKRYFLGEYLSEDIYNCLGGKHLPKKSE